MSKAESLAEDSEDWVRIGDAWAEMGNYPKAVDCYKESIDLSGALPSESEKTSLEWAREAEEQIRYTYSGALRCMVEAEYVAEGLDERVQIAKIWKESFQDSDNAIRCMKEAEDVAEYFEDYSAIEETWRVDFQDLDSDIRNSAIQRIVDAADDEGYFDGVREWLAARRDPAQEDATAPGASARSTATITGTWDSDCISGRRNGCYARYYKFTVQQEREVTIDLTSNVDTYLYLISGDVTDGEVLDENDDRPDDDRPDDDRPDDDRPDDDRPDDDGMGSTDSRIRRSLSPGTYTVEATTFHEEGTGDFTLTIRPGVVA